MGFLKSQSENEYQQTAPAECVNYTSGVGFS